MKNLLKLLIKKDKTIDNENKVVVPPSKKRYQPIFAVIKNTAEFINNESDNPII